MASVFHRFPYSCLSLSCWFMTLLVTKAMSFRYQQHSEVNYYNVMEVWTILKKNR